MRTSSQNFADLLKTSPEDAISSLKNYSWQDDYPLTWISLSGRCKKEWLDVLQEARVTPQQALKAICILISQKTDWQSKEPLACFLLDKIDDDTIKNSYLMHRAAFAGQHGFFKHVLDRGIDFDWNSTNDQGLPPLALALDRMHLDTAIDILHRGGLETFSIQDPQNKNKTTVIEWLFKKHQGTLGIFQSFWEVARNKYQLQKNIEQDTNASQQPGKKNRKKKM